ncbi:SCO7613 C-terminal domain-containing membrane protein [Ruicaihuangia caeni]|uniref:SCO7613 C-terminal domain-containing membrane protein n=1 Tax=Ruicaihuangia caeni TaxID=3042517 RepID=UPI0033906EF8
MTDPHGFERFAAPLTMPSSPEQLRDTASCPACFNRLQGPLCRACGLDLAHPAARDLLEASQDAAAALDRRAGVIGRIRFETSQRMTAAASPLPAAPTAAFSVAMPESEMPAAPASATGAATAPPVAASAPASAAPTFTPPAGFAVPPQPLPRMHSAQDAELPRRSSVQVALLVVGVTLLSIAAIFFLVYAFINFGLVWRSVIVGGLTLAAFATSHVLARRGLSATAEGIAAFALVLAYLDAWAIRENDLFGTAASDGLQYWGTSLVIISAAAVVWNRLSGLRVPSLAGFAFLLPGVALLGLGVGFTDFPDRLFAGSIVAAVAGFAWTLTPKTTERTIVLGQTLLAVVVAAMSAAFVGDPRYTPLVALLAVAAVSAAHTVVALRISDASTVPPSGPASESSGASGWSAPSEASASGSDIAERRKANRRTGAQIARAFAFAFGAVAGAAVAASALPLDTGWAPYPLLVPPLLAVIIALALDAVAGTRHGTARRVFAAASIAATVVAGLAAIQPIGTAVLESLRAAALGLAFPWREPADVVMSGPLEDLAWSLLFMLGSLTMAAVLWRLTGALQHRFPLVLWWGALLAVTAVPIAEPLWARLAGWSTIALASLLAAPLWRREASWRMPLMAMAITATALAYAACWSSRDTWWVQSVVVLLVLLGIRWRTQSNWAPPIVTGVGVVFLVGSAAMAAAHLAFGEALLPGVDAVDRLRFASIMATLLFGLGAAWMPGTADRRVVFWLAGSSAAVTVSLATVIARSLPQTARETLILPEPGVGLVIALALIAAILVWLRGGDRTQPELRPERLAASTALAPALALAAGEFARLMPDAVFFETIASSSAALVAAAGSLAAHTLGREALPRWSKDAGVAIVALPALAAAAAAGSSALWLVLVLSGVTVLLLAIDRDGLFASASQRRHLGWLALALTLAGMWWRLRDAHVAALEPYLLPLAGSLIAAGVLIARRRGAHRAGALIALAGALVGILPLAADYADGAALPAIVLFGVSGLLLLAGSALQGVVTEWHAAALAAGAAGATSTALARALLSHPADLERDWWLLALVAVLVLASLALAQALDLAFDRERVGRDDQFAAVHRFSIGRPVAASGLLALAMVAATIGEASAFDASAGDARALLLVSALGAVHVLSVVRDRAPFERWVGWPAIGLAAVTAVIALVVVEPIELVTVPLGTALLLAGAVRMLRDPEAGSWPWLAPGLLAILVPSLVATVDDRPLWRLVGIGVIAVAAIVVGVTRRLQSPFAIGVAAALVHGIATFLPQLRTVYEAVPWWLWLGAGGVLLIVLAARYEQRLNNLKSMALRFAALR